jgi:hypothetical protein
MLALGQLKGPTLSCAMLVVIGIATATPASADITTRSTASSRPLGVAPLSAAQKLNLLRSLSTTHYTNENDAASFLRRRAAAPGYSKRASSGSSSTKVLVTLAKQRLALTTKQAVAASGADASQRLQFFHATTAIYDEALYVTNACPQSVILDSGIQPYNSE